MRGPTLLEKSPTKKGEASILIILITAAVILLILMPVFAILFDRGLVKLAIQEISDEIDLSTYLIYQHLDLEHLSRKDLVIDEEMLEDINGLLDFDHPQIEHVQVQAIDLDNKRLVLHLSIILEPTLYRTLYNLNQSYDYDYVVLIPIDGE